RCDRTFPERQLRRDAEIDGLGGSTIAPAAKAQHLRLQRLDPCSVLEQLLLELFGIVRQGCVVERHAAILRKHAHACCTSSRLDALLCYTTCRGGHVRTGRRQSMPSSSIDSCAGVSATEP